jgi:purine-binding chemotaxis protein CheW
MPDDADDGAREILEERARALARPLQTDEPVEEVELVVLAVGSERYGVDSAKVQEVRPLGELTPVPGAPPFWAGVVNVRGTLYPVLDLGRYFDLPGAEAGEGTQKVVLVAAAGLAVGLMVSDASGVRRLPADAVGPSLEGVSEVVSASVRGVTEDLLAILDVEALLQDPRLLVREVVT